MTKGQATVYLLNVNGAGFVDTKKAQTLGEACRVLGLDWDETLDICERVGYESHRVFVRMGWNQEGKCKE